jgi:trans-aconitate 2-methyltransferase
VTWDAATYERVADPQEAWAREVLDRSRFTRDDTVLDGDAAMVAEARAALPPEVPVHHQDLLDLTLPEPVDAVFSNAVFHWVTDHDRLFTRLRAALRPGGRLVAQCGGAGNIAGVLRVVGERPGTWLYASAEDTERRLRAAGFAQARAWLEPKPTRVPDMATYLESVVLHGTPDARAVAERAAAELEELDYVRLNIDAVAG